MTVRRLAMISMAALALLAAAVTALAFSEADASSAFGLSEPLRPRLRAVDEAGATDQIAAGAGAAAPDPLPGPEETVFGEETVLDEEAAGLADEVLDTSLEATPLVDTGEPAPQPIATPEPALPRSGTPATEAQVNPATLVEIPADLISTPTPLPDAGPSLPMLTNIPSTPRDGSVVYLTFDDGPDPVYTNQILDVLARYNARATFFVIGNSVDAYPGVVQRIVAEGHTVANHTYRHEALPNISPEQVTETLAATSAALNRAIGRSSPCLRPPYGALNQATYDQIVGLGYTVHMWEVDSEDWKTNDSYTIAATVLSTTSLGNRVLFHDGPTNRASTVAALESVLEVLTNRGVTFQALNC